MHAVRLKNNVVTAVRSDTVRRDPPGRWMDVESRADRNEIEPGKRYDRADDRFVWPEPTAKLTVSASAIAQGGKVTLRWVTEHALSAEISSSASGLPPYPCDPVEAGEIEVSPERTTTYQLTATGREGTTPATARRRVTVRAPGS